MKSHAIYLHRVHEKNYNTVYVAITLANNVGFKRNSMPTLWG